MRNDSMNMTLNRNDNNDNHETKKDTNEDNNNETKKDNNENENDDTGKDVSPSSPSSPEKFLAECVTPRLNSAIKKTKQVLHRTETVVETHVLCSPMRWMIHFPREWPRVSTFLFAVVLPLWILIAVAMGFGVLLAQYESPTEIEGNDAILAARAQIAFFDVSAANLLNITNVCWTEWEQTFFGRNDTTQDFQFNNINDTIMENEEGYAWINRSLLEDSLNRCTSSYLPQMQKLQEVTQNNSEAFESLRFNWNRCWDTEIFGNSNLVVHPTEAQKIAATPAAQEEYFNEVWTSMQVDLYQQYLPPNPTSEEEEEAFLRSVQEATGVSACTENTGGTAWFFFTIMTTIGYGNQAPITTEGRMLLVTAGLFSLILFGAVLGLCGYVLLAIFDDMVGRFGFAHRVGHPVIAMFLWGTIWLVYALAIATDVDYWWQERLPEFAADIDGYDALWFAYVSTSTIGLGDYYLQPEVIFASDTLKYSVLFMIGFVFLSTFFGKIAECLALLLPKKHNSLEARLAATRVLACWPRGFMPWEKIPDQLTNVAEMVPDDQALIYRIEQVKALKPDPPVEENGEQNRTLVGSLTGDPIHSLNVELLKQEETLLLEWIAVVQHQQQRAIQIREREKQVEEPRERSALFTIAETPSGSKPRDKAPDQTSSDSSTDIGGEKCNEVADVNIARYDTKPPTPLTPPPRPPILHEDDMSTVVSPAEESFNPLATFFSSA